MSEPHEEAPEGTVARQGAAREAAHWVEPVSRLTVSSVPQGALNPSVAGRRLTDPIQPDQTRALAPVQWSGEIDAVITGDLTAALAYGTPAGGGVVTPVAPCGLEERGRGILGFTTSLGFPKKLHRIVRDPRIALAFHARDHGFSTSTQYVLVQGRATVDLKPSRGDLEALAPQAERFLGSAKRGRVWDWLLREYYLERVFVHISVRRVSAWDHLDASGVPRVIGAAMPPAPAPQAPPKKGVAPRVSVARLHRQVQRLPHRLVAFQGADGFPVVVPMRLMGHGPEGLHLSAAANFLPPGGRRAGLLAHSYRPQLVGLSTRVCTGWLNVDEDGSAVYAPHTSKGFVAPPAKHLLLVSNGLIAKVGLMRARRAGVAEVLAGLKEQT